MTFKLCAYTIVIPEPANVSIGIGHLGGAVGFVISAVVIAGYVAGRPSWGLFAGTTTMALSTAMVLLVLSVAVLCITTAVHLHLQKCHVQRDREKS